MNGLLGPGSQPNLFYKRKLKQSDYRTVPHKYYYVLSLHLAGKSAQEIAELAITHFKLFTQFLRRMKL